VVRSDSSGLGKSGELNHEAGEPVVSFLKHQLPTVGADDFAGQAQAQAHALHGTAARGVSTIEALEEANTICGRDARAGIGNAHQDLSRDPLLGRRLAYWLSGLSRSAIGASSAA
jgi:hypothetical protein